MTEETFWQATWRWIKVFARKLLAPGAALLIVIGAVLLVAIGYKELRIGGLLGKLLGKSESNSRTATDIANTIPKERIDANGNLIPIGQPDSEGIKQAQVVPIEEPGLFSDPGTVVIKPPGKEPIEIKLPDGIQAKDVDSVVIVSPEVTVVTVKDTSPITATQIDDLLTKYGD